MKKAFLAFCATVGAVLLALILLPSGTALAEGVDTSPSAPIVVRDTVATLHLSAAVITAFIGTLVPVLNGLITRSTSARRPLYLLALSLVVGFVTNATLNDGSAVFSWQALAQFGITAFAAWSTYAGLWKPLNITNSRKVIDATGTEVVGSLVNKGPVKG